jgi:hypothetical protein
MTLTQEQLQEVRNGKSVRLYEEGTDFVILRADVFERLQSLLDLDTIYTTGETMDRIMAEDDVNDAYLAELQKKYGGVQS